MEESMTVFVVVIWWWWWCCGGGGGGFYASAFHSDFKPKYKQIKGVPIENAERQAWSH